MLAVYDDPIARSKRMQMEETRTLAGALLMAPFGGAKRSGFGRENGPEGVEGFVQTKSVLLGG